MAQAKKGDTVHVHYTGRLKNGSVFDSSDNRDPLKFTVGAGQMIPGFDAAVEGMEVGESKTVDIPMEQAYGPSRTEMLIKVDRKDIPADIELEAGLQLMVHQPDGTGIPVTVTEITDETVTLDANHSLAGQDLIFDIKLVQIGQ